MHVQQTILALKLAAVSALVAAAAFWHHVRIREFIQSVYDSLSDLLPESLREHNLQMRPSILQVYFGSPAVHYEVRVRHKKRCLELGLHFEGEREENHRWVEALAPHALEIQRRLGPNIELEEWTRKWTRLHESLPLDVDPKQPISRALTEELAGDIARRLARLIEVMEPLLAQEQGNVVGR